MSTRIPEEPPKVRVEDERTIRSHPAYAMISASRGSGSPILFGSALDMHNGFITVSIRTAEMIQDRVDDRAFPRQHLVEVKMSYAQWAEFVSTISFGSGVPCTLRAVHGEWIPQIQQEPPPVDRASERVKEAAGALLPEWDERVERIRTLLDKIPKGAREAVLRELHAHESHLRSSIPFYVDMVEEVLTKRIVAAKSEADGVIAVGLQRLGVRALHALSKLTGKDEPPELLENGEDR